MTDNIVIIRPNDTHVTIVEEVNRVTVRSPGPKGNPGASGTTVETDVAADTVSAYKVLALEPDGLVHADPTNLEHFYSYAGVSLQSGTVGANIDFKVTGEVTGGVFTPEAKYWLGLDGALSTNPVAVGAVWMKYIGYARDAQTLILNSGPAILI